MIDPDRVLVVDIETTGSDVATAAIVELALVRLDGAAVFHEILDPGIPIPEAATAVHGITDDVVAGRPGFEGVSREVQGLIDSASAIAGYNSRDFDVAVLDAELRRARLPGIPADLPDLDAYRFWLATEARTLDAALVRFVGELPSEGRHRAADDARSAARVLRAMAESFNVSLDEIAEATRDSTFVDRAGKFRRNGEGEIVFSFGKFSGRTAASERDYLRWMIGADFPPDTKEVARKILYGEPTAVDPNQIELLADA